MNFNSVLVIFFTFNLVQPAPFFGHFLNQDPNQKRPTPIRDAISGFASGVAQAAHSFGEKVRQPGALLGSAKKFITNTFVPGGGQNQPPQSYPDYSGGQNYPNGQGYYPNGGYPGGQNYYPGGYPGHGGQGNYPGYGGQNYYPGGQNYYPGSTGQGMFPPYNQGSFTIDQDGTNYGQGGQPTNQGSYPSGGQNVPTGQGGQTNVPAGGNNGNNPTGAVPGTASDTGREQSSSTGQFFPGQTGPQQPSSNVFPSSSGSDSVSGQQSGFPQTAGVGSSTSSGGQNSQTGQVDVPSQGFSGSLPVVGSPNTNNEGELSGTDHSGKRESSTPALTDEEILVINSLKENFCCTYPAHANCVSIQSELNCSPGASPENKAPATFENTGETTISPEFSFDIRAGKST